jgi:putative oxidoreductase
MRSRSFTRGDLALFLLRTAAAIPLFFHGSQKLFGWFDGGGLSGFASYLEGLGVPFPSLAAPLAAVSEIVGVVILLSGRGFRALPPVVATMAVAAATSARNGFDVSHGGAEFPLTVAILLVVLVLSGPGSLVVRIARPSAP